MDKPSETTSPIEEVEYARFGQATHKPGPDDRKVISGFEIALATIVALPMAVGFLIILFLLLGGNADFLVKCVGRLL